MRAMINPLRGMSPKAIGLAAAITTVLIWTSFIVVARAMALRSLSPLDIVFCRVVGASMVLLPWGWWLTRKARQSKDPSIADSWWISPLPLRLTATIGLFGGIGYACLAYSGFIFAPASHASVLLPGMLPLTTALIAVVVLNEKITLNRGLGLALIISGGFFVGGLSIWQSLKAGGEVWKGDLFFIAASTCWSTYTVLCRKHRLDAVKATIAVVVFCALTYIPIYSLMILTGQFGPLPVSRLLDAPIGEIVFQALWQGVGSVVISGITFTKMVQAYGPVRATMFTAIVPGSSALAAVIFLGEPLYWNLILGLTLVTFGILIGVRASAAPATSPPK